MNAAWICLLVAGLFEIGWPVGLKLAQAPGRMVPGIAIAVGCMALSGGFLWMAQKGIPMGTAYAVWTGVGAAGTFLVGIAVYGDPTGWTRLSGIGLIIAGVATLKMAH
ncbi:MAG: multidrug efflux SMR transporter [Verrucomicrobiae bacterium]|nr:multidrug efflux SMR transporter [Verrucomicrobiae bacterium]